MSAPRMKRFAASADLGMTTIAAAKALLDARLKEIQRLAPGANENNVELRGAGEEILFEDIEILLVHDRYETPEEQAAREQKELDDKKALFEQLRQELKIPINPVVRRIP